jgi:predicted AAA+ superfamily ATPase
MANAALHRHRAEGLIDGRPQLSAGGYPELVGRSARGRSRFFSSYVASMIGRDVGDIANPRNVENVERLLHLIAARSGALANFGDMASKLGVDAHTVRSYTKILEDLFLVRRLKPWLSNLGSRHVKTPSNGGEVVGIEVKATATPSRQDLAGLRYLRDKLGARFKAGAVLYTGSDTLPYGERLAAVPLSGLWEY